MLVITGSMSSAEEGALQGACAAGVKTDGLMVASNRVIGGSRPIIALKYNLRQTDSTALLERTKQMAQISDLTIFMGRKKIRAYQTMAEYCSKFAIPIESVTPDHEDASFHMAYLIMHHRAHTVFITGDREDRTPGLKDRVAQIVEKALNLVIRAENGSNQDPSHSTVSVQATNLVSVAE